MAVTDTSASPPRNPGPSWGYRTMVILDRILPEFIFRSIRRIGTWIAVASMPQQRHFSREYLRIALGREPGTVDVFRHFFAVCEALMLRLRVAHGRPHLVRLEPSAGDFKHWMSSDLPVLLGTFHIGNSDLTGFLLAGQEKRRVSIVRLRVGNSHDVESLVARFGNLLQFVWVNDPSQLLFALKEAGSGSSALALQCDRPDHSARSEQFDFLGGRRTFPFTIYYLALIFSRPVLLSFGVPYGKEESFVYASPVFEPLAGESRAAALERARAHFQAFLRRVDEHLRAHPYDWLNFLPL